MDSLLLAPLLLVQPRMLSLPASAPPLLPPSVLPRLPQTLSHLQVASDNLSNLQLPRASDSEHPLLLNLLSPLVSLKQLLLLPSSVPNLSNSRSQGYSVSLLNLLRVLASSDRRNRNKPPSVSVELVSLFLRYAQ